MKILIDAGHGVETLGKRSPDGKLLEYKWAREIADRVTDELRRMGYDAERLERGDHDVPLSTRVTDANRICRNLGQANVLLISIHVNAAGNGKEWKNAGGWCAYTCKGRTKSDDVAEFLYDQAKFYLHDYESYMRAEKAKGNYSNSQKFIRTDFLDGDSDLEEDFYILKNTKCAAVLTENLFMDCKADYDYLLSEYGKSAIVNLHVDGIIDYLNSIKK